MHGGYDDEFDALQRYGPVVRVGPNRVAFRNVETMKTIYGTHRFRKSNWYSVFTVGGADHMFSYLCDGPFHSLLIRLNDRRAGILFPIPAHAASVLQLSEVKRCAQLVLCFFKRWKTSSVDFAVIAPVKAISMSSRYSPS